MLVNFFIIEEFAYYTTEIRFLLGNNHIVIVFHDLFLDKIPVKLKPSTKFIEELFKKKTYIWYTTFHEEPTESNELTVVAYRSTFNIKKEDLKKLLRLDKNRNESEYINLVKRIIDES